MSFTQQSASRPLGDHVLFTSSAIDEAEYEVGRVFCPHRLNPKNRVKLVNARMHHVRVTGQSSLNFLEYGNEVVVEPGTLGDFFNVQVQLSGKVKTRCGRQVNTIKSGQAAVLSAGEFVSMQWTADSSMLIYSIDRKKVEQKLGSLLNGPVRQPLVFEGKMTHHSSAGAGWLRAISLFQQELDASPGFLNYPHAVVGFEESLVLSLLFGQPHNYSSLFKTNVFSVAPGHVKRVEEYIRENAGQQISIEDLTRVAQTSARSVFAGFRQYRGTTPMNFLRDVRLENARKDLLIAPPGTSVTDVAGRWGFCQFGRFAGAYREKFGELPSETLKKSI